MLLLSSWRLAQEALGAQGRNIGVREGGGWEGKTFPFQRTRRAGGKPWGWGPPGRSSAQQGTETRRDGVTASQEGCSQQGLSCGPRKALGAVEPLQKLFWFPPNTTYLLRHLIQPSSAVWGGDCPQKEGKERKWISHAERNHPNYYCVCRFS